MRILASHLFELGNKFAVVRLSKFDTGRYVVQQLDLFSEAAAPERSHTTDDGPEAQVIADAWASRLVREGWYLTQSLVTDDCLNSPVVVTNY